MNLLSRRSLLAMAAVVDVALHARPAPVAARALSARHVLPPRHLETLLQTLVRAKILKGVRGPRGGYELARERRRISAGDIVRAVMSEGEAEATPESRLVCEVINPLLNAPVEAFLRELDGLSVDEMCRRAEAGAVFDETTGAGDFTI